MEVLHAPADETAASGAATTFSSSPTNPAASSSSSSSSSSEEEEYSAEQQPSASTESTTHGAGGLHYYAAKRQRQIFRAAQQQQHRLELAAEAAAALAKHEAELWVAQKLDQYREQQQRHETQRVVRKPTPKLFTFHDAVTAATMEDDEDEHHAGAPQQLSCPPKKHYSSSSSPRRKSTKQRHVLVETESSSSSTSRGSPPSVVVVVVDNHKTHHNHKPQHPSRHPTSSQSTTTESHSCSRRGTAAAAEKNDRNDHNEDDTNNNKNHHKTLRDDSFSVLYDNVEVQVIEDDDDDVRIPSPIRERVIQTMDSLTNLDDSPRKNDSRRRHTSQTSKSKSKSSSKSKRSSHANSSPSKRSSRSRSRSHRSSSHKNHDKNKATAMTAQQELEAEAALIPPPAVSASLSGTAIYHGLANLQKGFSLDDCCGAGDGGMNPQEDCCDDDAFGQILKQQLHLQQRQERTVHKQDAQKPMEEGDVTTQASTDVEDEDDQSRHSSTKDKSCISSTLRTGPSSASSSFPSDEEVSWQLSYDNHKSKGAAGTTTTTTTAISSKSSTTTKTTTTTTRNQSHCSNSSQNQTPPQTRSSPPTSQPSSQATVVVMHKQDTNKNNNKTPNNNNNNNKTAPTRTSPYLSPRQDQYSFTYTQSFQSRGMVSMAPSDELENRQTKMMPTDDTAQQHDRQYHSVVPNNPSFSMSMSPIPSDESPENEVVPDDDNMILFTYPNGTDEKGNKVLPNNYLLLSPQDVYNRLIEMAHGQDDETQKATNDPTPKTKPSTHTDEQNVKQAQNDHAEDDRLLELISMEGEDGTPAIVFVPSNTDATTGAITPGAFHHHHHMGFSEHHETTSLVTTTDSTANVDHVVAIVQETLSNLEAVECISPSSNQLRKARVTNNKNSPRRRPRHAPTTIAEETEKEQDTQPAQSKEKTAAEAAAGAIKAVTSNPTAASSYFMHVNDSGILRSNVTMAHTASSMGAGGPRGKGGGDTDPVGGEDLCTQFNALTFFAVAWCHNANHHSHSPTHHQICDSAATEDHQHAPEEEEDQEQQPGEEAKGLS